MLHRDAILIDLATLDRKAGRLEQSRRWWEKVLPIRPRPSRNDRTTFRHGKTWASPTPSFASRRLPQGISGS